MLDFTPITAALLAAALQASSGAPTVTTSTSAERLARSLAEWELYAATSGDDAAAATTLEALAAEARAAAAAAPSDAAIARAAAAVEAAHVRFRAERGLEHPAGQDPGQQAGQEPRDPRATDEEVIAMAILNHLHADPSKEHQDAILRFGVRAVPALVSSARSMNAANALGAPAIALDTLAMIDPLKALEVSWDLSAQPSFLVRQAIAGVLNRRMVYTRDDVWVEGEGGDDVPAAPEWGELVERLLSEPALAPKDLRNVLAACAMRGFAPQVVIDAILSLDEIQDWPQLGFVPPGTRPLYIAGLQHPRAEVRRHCAGRVSQFPDVTPLFALHSDKDLQVRSTVANALGERDLAQPGPTPGSSKLTKVPPVPGPEHQAALERCLSDEQVDVSRIAGSRVQHAYYNLSISLLPPDNLARLAVSVPHLDIRMMLLRVFARSAPEFVAGVAEHTLSDPAVRANAGYYLEAYNAISGTYFVEHAPAIAPAILAALEAHATPEEWGIVFDRDNSNNTPPELLVHLPDNLRVQLVRSLARHSPHAAWRLRKWRNSVPHDTAPWRALVSDASASHLARAVAAAWSLGETTPSPEVLSAIIEAVRRLAQDQAPSRPAWCELAQWVNNLSGDLAEKGVPRQRLLGALFADPSVPDELLLEVRIHSARDDEERAELVRAVLARFPCATWDAHYDRLLIVDVLGFAHTLNRERRVALIECALEGRGAWWSRALEAAGRSRDPELVGTLRRFSERLTGDDYLLWVAQAAASLLSDEAAKLILDLAARASNSELRAKILESLQQVIDYQTALSNWQQRNDATAVRVRAIAELVAVIDDPSVPEAQRAEALRGLGLLGAVEELPRLVRMLNAPSAALQAAAREALDRLNAAPVK